MSEVKTMTKINGRWFLPIDVVKEYFYLVGSAVHWKKHRFSQRIGARADRWNGAYYVLTFQQRQLYAHKIVFALTHGRWPVADIDHINRDRRDNRVENLREATTEQNMANKVTKKNIGFRGVIKTPRCKSSYKASIKHEGKTYYLGTFRTAEEAAIARDKKAIELLGSFAILNFPDKPWKHLMEGE